MDDAQFAPLAIMRAVIGFLGEREQYAWWQSSFFSPLSRTFLMPVFGRTILLAQCMGVTQAAALVHDERIGVGRVYHLFRLPEDVEQAIHRGLHTAPLAMQIAASVASQDAALAYLRGEARNGNGGGVGPIQVGAVHQLRERKSWRSLTAQYVCAFERGEQVFPYFSEHV